MRGRGYSNPSRAGCRAATVRERTWLPLSYGRGSTACAAYSARKRESLLPHRQDPHAFGGREHGCLRIHFLEDSLLHAQEGGGESGIELPAALLLDLGEGGGRLQAIAIGTVGGHGIVGVGQGHDAGQRRNGLATKSVGIAFAVPTLVVRADDGDDRSQVWYGGNDLRTLDRVALHDLEFFGR